MTWSPAVRNTWSKPPPHDPYTCFPRPNKASHSFIIKHTLGTRWADCLNSRPRRLPPILLPTHSTLWNRFQRIKQSSKKKEQNCGCSAWDASQLGGENKLERTNRIKTVYSIYILESAMFVTNIKTYSNPMDITFMKPEIGKNDAQNLQVWKESLFLSWCTWRNTKDIYQ